MKNWFPIPRRAALIGRLAATGLLALSSLPAQAQGWKTAPTVPTNNAAPAVGAAVLPEVVVTGTASTNDPKADKAWRELERAEKADPMPPVSLIFKFVVGASGEKTWRNVFEKFEIPEAMKKADKARDFSARFPNHPKCWAARIYEYQNLADTYESVNNWNSLAARLKKSGSPPDSRILSFTNLLPRIITLEKQFLENTNWSPSQRFWLREQQVSRLSCGPFDDYAEAAKALQRDFPQETDPYWHLREVMGHSGQNNARLLAQTVIDGSAPEKEKAPFRGYLQRLALVGEPMSIRLTTLEGKEVNTAKMKGKVVLVVVGGPHALPFAAPADVYEQFRARGFEIIEIMAADKDEARGVKKLMKAFKVPWPLYFVGETASKDLARHYGLFDGSFILLDKQGVLRATSDSEALEHTIPKLPTNP
jgi:hypothetical protein